MTHLRVIAIVLAAFSALAGCNTVAGIGEDITGVARAAQGGISAGFGGGYNSGGQF